MASFILIESLQRSLEAAIPRDLKPPPQPAQSAECALFKNQALLSPPPPTHPRDYPQLVQKPRRETTKTCH